MSEKQNDKLAVLIDVDNAQASIITELLEEISKFGIASIKRAYGDWTTTNLKSWKEYLHKERTAMASERYALYSSLMAMK